MSSVIKNSVADVIRAANVLATEDALQFMHDASEMIANCFASGGKILIAGNGGSLCDAMHFAEELTGYFREKRKALPSIALADPGHITCVGNDTSFADIFSRGIEAHGKEGDIFISLTTSGNSSNLVQAANRAVEMGLSTIAFLGKTGGKIKGICDLEWIVEGFTFSDRIQEAHMAAIHIIIEQVEHILFASNKVSQLMNSK